MRKSLYWIGGIFLLLWVAFQSPDDGRTHASRPGTDLDVIRSEPLQQNAPLQSHKLKPEPKTPKRLTKTLYVDASSLRMRAGPGTGFEQIGSYPRGSQVAFTGDQNGSWRKVTGQNGQTGWMHQDYLSQEKVAVVVPQVTRTAPAKARAPNDSDLKKQIIRASISRYRGNCPCPYNRDSAGRRCGKRSAYSKPGGASPICYESDISSAMLARWR